MHKRTDLPQHLAVAGLPALGTALCCGVFAPGNLIAALVVATALTLLAVWFQTRYQRSRDSEFAATIRSLSRSLQAPHADLATAKTTELHRQISSESSRDKTPHYDALRQLDKEISQRIQQLESTNRALTKSDSRYQSILESMAEGVLLIDRTGRIIFGNSSAGRLLDRSTRLVEGKHLWETVRNAELQSTIELAFDGDGIVRHEFEHPWTKSILGINAVPIEVNNGPGLLIVLHDVTELRRLEKMRREFVSNVSHELKTPLTAIQAYADTLIEGGLEDPENSQRFVHRILEQADRLQTLIQDMLRLARIESQADAFQLQAVSLSEILESCVDARQAVARSREIHLTYESAEDPITVIADREGLRTIFDNLINNALNYTPEDGTVAVRGYCRGKMAIVEVQDNGIGIPQEHQSRVFERFYRVDKARSRGMGGTGLGLAIVKRCLSVFRGEIQLESEIGRGTLFRIQLPLAEQSVQTVL